MSKTNTSALMFDEEEVATTVPLLPRLIRIFFFRLRITNDDYLSRYHRFLKEHSFGTDAKSFGAQVNADRKTLRDKSGLTFKKMRSVLDAMGHNVESVTIVTRDRLTGETMKFSSDDTVEFLKECIEKESEVGVSSFLG